MTILKLSTENGINEIHTPMNMVDLNTYIKEQLSNDTAFLFVENRGFHKSIVIEYEILDEDNNKEINIEREGDEGCSYLG